MTDDLPPMVKQDHPGGADAAALNLGARSGKLLAIDPKVDPINMGSGLKTQRVEGAENLPPSAGKGPIALVLEISVDRNDQCLELRNSGRKPNIGT